MRSPKPKTWFLVCAILCLVATGIEAGLLLTTTTHDARSEPVRSVTKGGDFFAEADVFAPSSNHLAGEWSSGPGGAPDRVLLVAGPDVARILAGQAPQQVIATFPATSWHGQLDFRVPPFTCGGPTGGCRDGDLPALVWTRGRPWGCTSPA